MSGDTEPTLDALQCMGDETTFAGSTHLKKVSFELVGDTQQVRVNRFWVYVSRLEGDIKCERARCWRGTSGSFFGGPQHASRGLEGGNLELGSQPQCQSVVET